MPIYKGTNEITSGNFYKGSTNIENGYKQTDSFFVNLVTIQFSSISGQGFTYTLPTSRTGDPGSLYPSTTFTILSNISANSTLTLPAGSAGDSIKIVNMSAFDSNGNYVAPSFTWTINPNGSEKIMRASNLVLDESTSSFELYYADAANGWVINGIS